RADGPGALLADLHRDEPDVLPDALPRNARDAAAYLHLRRRPGLQRDEPAGDPRLLPPRGRDAALRLQPGRLLAAREAGRAEPLGRGDAGVGHPLPAPGVQLPRDPGGP